MRGSQLHGGGRSRVLGRWVDETLDPRAVVHSPHPPPGALVLCAGRGAEVRIWVGCAAVPAGEKKRERLPSGWAGSEEASRLCVRAFSLS